MALTLSFGEIRNVCTGPTTFRRGPPDLLFTYSLRDGRAFSDVPAPQASDGWRPTTTSLISAFYP
eukprot:scaffold38661_cov34-Tisochrysis_lutea.AAC.2